MFKLLESGLPKSPLHLPSFADLGYFINDEDEIRSIANPLSYFNYFVTKNERFNNLQRYAMNTAIKDEVLKRLESRGLRSMRLPIGVSENDPHTTVLVSSNLQLAKRVIVLFYEHTQDLGIFAHRIIGGRGGIDKGSAVCFVDYIQSLSENPTSATENFESCGDAPAIILANMGQLRWWRKGKQAITQISWYSIPRQSAVHPACRFDEVKNVVPGNRNTEEHVAYMFNKVFNGDMLQPEAKLQIIGVADGAYQVVNYLNEKQNWDACGKRLNALALLAPYHTTEFITNLEFASWLQKRGRAYTVSSSAPTTVLGSISDPQSSAANYGCPTFSLGEQYYSEVLLPRGYKIVLDFFQEVAAVGDYENPNVVVGDVGQVDILIDGYGGRLKTEKAAPKIDDRPNESSHSFEASTSRTFEDASDEAKPTIHLREDEVEPVEDRSERAGSRAKLALNLSNAAEDMHESIRKTSVSEAETKAEMAPTGELVKAVYNEQKYQARCSEDGVLD